MISSVHNEKIKEYAKLKQRKYRDQSGLFIVEGFHLVEEAQKNNLVIEIITIDPKIKGTLVSEKIFQKLSQQLNPQSILAICKKRPLQTIGNKVVLLNNLQDPGNVGNIIRSAKAFGFSDVIIEGVDLYNSKTITASQGAIFEINCFNVSSSAQFIEKNLDYNVIGTILDKKATTIDKIILTKKMLFVFGNEGSGIAQDVLSLLKQNIYIPIAFESLNVAATAAIILHHFQKGENHEKRT